jgi:3-oxoacyl-[acyl-carrier protein] reductase
VIDMTGKVVLVTGSSRGIGRSLARAFQSAGCTVHINGTRSSPADYSETLEGLIYHQGDLSSVEGAVRLHGEVGPVDVLVNNFGGSGPDEFTIEGFRASIHTNLMVAAELSMLYYDTLASRGGSIVNVGSVSSHLALRETPGYIAGKSGMWGLTRALADKWAPQGIRVNMIATGFVNTDLTALMRADPEREKRLIATVPMRRWAHPDEIGGAAVFLASDLASYITGISLAVDGGLMVR